MFFLRSPKSNLLFHKPFGTPCRLSTKNLGYIFGVWRLLYPPSREEVISECFFHTGQQGKIYEPVVGRLEAQVCVFCAVFSPMRAGSAPCVCLKSEQEVGLRRAFVSRWIPRLWEQGPNSGPRAMWGVSHHAETWAKEKDLVLVLRQGSQWLGDWEGYGKGH